MATVRMVRDRYYVRYTDGLGRRRQIFAGNDKQQADNLAIELQAQAIRDRCGLSDPFLDLINRTARRSIRGLINEWHEALNVRGVVTKYAQNQRVRVLRIVSEAKVVELRELTPAKIELALAQLRIRGLSAQTVRHHLGAVKNFARWLIREHKLRTDPTLGIRTANPENDRRRERRVLTDEECTDLIASAEIGPMHRWITGPDRAMAYRLALNLALRAGEIRSLTTSNFDLGAVPTLHLKSTQTKNRQAVRIPIPTTLAELLRPWLAEKGPGPILPIPRECARMVALDLERVGHSYRDDEGKVADFHALRHTAITRWANARYPVPVVQKLARHSTPVLTFGVYGHADQSVLREAVEATAVPELEKPILIEDALRIPEVGPEPHAQDVAKRLPSSASPPWLTTVSFAQAGTNE